MRRFLLPVLVACAAVALLALLAFGVASQGANTSLDASLARGIRPPAPSQNVALPVLGATTTRTLSSFRGKLVLLNVFASWCDPCKAEAPILRQAELTLQRHDGTVLGVTYLDNSSDSERFVKQEGINYPVVRDVSGNFVRSFGTTGVPESFVIDRQGRVAALRRYQLDSQWLHQVLPRVIAAGA